MKVFNSQICTSREQSERLLALGVKPETADMAIEPDLESTYEVYYISAYPPSKRGVPAWSLHRLMEIMPQCIYHKNRMCFLFIDQSVYVQYRHSLYGASQTIMEQFMKSNLWDNLINCIEWLIKEGYFNKEYLNGTTEN